MEMSSTGNAKPKELAMIENIKTKISDGVLCLQIHRPEKRNAMTPEMYSDLAAQLRMANNDEGVKVVVLYGTENCFTSGNDLNGFRNGPSPDKQYPHNVFLKALSETRKPVMAAVSGPALGIGTITLLHCDMVYAAPDTMFSFPFINLGLSPEGGTSYLLPRLAGNRRAMEMVLFGEQFGVDLAGEIGLINEVVTTQSLLERVMERAKVLAKRSADSVQMSKALLKSSTEAAIAEAMQREREVFSDRLASEEAQNAIARFFKSKS
jgi:enoyl-CoA hydratase/carnithine racemase